MQGFLYDGDYPLMPLFVIPGVLALVTGFVLLAIAVLLAIPNGVAWFAVGYVLWSGEAPHQPARVR